MEEKRKKVALVLGGGGARGVMHIGALRVLKENNIPIDMVVGTSMGSFIAGTYALYQDPDLIEKMVLQQLDSKTLLWFFDLTTHGGIAKGERMEKWMDDWFKGKTFEELQIPLAVVAADINSGQPVTLNSGYVASAIRASTAIPPAIKPFNYQAKMLIDGWVADPLPVGVAKEMGADIVIGVMMDSTEHKKYDEDNISIQEALNRSFAIMSEQIIAHKKPFADYIIKPKTGDVVIGGKLEEMAEKDKLMQHIKAGEVATIDALDDIKKLL
ncbi:MAG: patatin-like phospholipase family protein [Patescibacteria group bacterium]|nr:patatin-like phospholipase family protein [Patescibacteria group bacterium]